jgi:hypothetical protein
MKRFAIILLRFFAVLFIICILGIVAVYATLFVEVRKNCTIAEKEYKNPCVTSLQRVAADTTKGFRRRNDAVWTLGQLADRRALTTLKKLYTGTTPAREPLDVTLSQYEIKKAIGWIEQGNWTSWMYGMYR